MALSGPANSAPHVYNYRGVSAVRACSQLPAPGHARCHALVVTNAVGHLLVNEALAVRPNVLPNTPPSGLGPSDLRAAYGISGQGKSTTTVAIVDALGYPNAEADLNVYRARYGLPACTTANHCFRKVNQNGVQGHYPAADTGWSQETALDLDMVSAMCPGCSILLVEANSTSQNDLSAAVNRAVKLGAHVVSNSYGGDEAGSAPFEAAYDHPGVAITVSSGDEGFGVEFPASSPHVTAVGGTSLTKVPNTRGWIETAWSGAGSGCSAVFAKPAWQKDPLCKMRTVADVSAVADPATGVAVYGPSSDTASGWMVFGGTSVAAPVIGGIYGENGGPVKFGSDPYGRTSDLNDVTSGSNGSCGGSYLCTAGPGYDGPTGLGTPKDDRPF
jgi:subtilase family serine protease